MRLIGKCRRFTAFTAVLIFIFILSGCPGLFSSFGPLPIEYSAEILNLSWDDNGGGIEGIPSAVDHYDLYYRSLGMVSWVYLMSTSDNQTTASVSQTRTGYGKFEFAVQTVHENGLKSKLHTSADLSAWPPGGWYVNWHE